MTSDKKAFTLVELLIAMSISAIVIGGLLSFNIQLIKGGLYSENKNKINRDVRKVTSDLGGAAKEANYFVIYSSFESADRDDPDDRLVSDQSGDFILFVHTAPKYVSFGVHPVERLVGYYRSARKIEGLTNVGPVMKFDVTFSSPVDITNSDAATLEDLIPSKSSVKADEILELSKGTANGKLFYNFGNKSAMVNGQFYHGNNLTRITDTYNFTVSPRG